MPLLSKDLPSLLANASREGADAFGQGAENSRLQQQLALKKFLTMQEPALAGKKQAAQNSANMDTILDPRLDGMRGEGSSIKAGDITVGQDPMVKLATQGPAQAKTLHGIAGSTYKSITDQLTAARDTLDSLNQKNDTADKLALINEARIAAGAGGSRALKGIMDSLTGGRTAGSDFQGALNYINNTPNLPKMTDAQRDAIRESVFGRIPSLDHQHRQAAAQLEQQAPQIAPRTDYTSIVKSYTSPAEENLNLLKQSQAQYAQQRQAMPGPQGPVSQPSQADPNPSTVDKLLGYLGMGTASSQAAPAQAPQAQPQARAQPQAAPAQSGTIKVRHKQTGKTGTMPAANFNPSLYEQL
jgi:hypothetical protein